MHADLHDFPVRDVYLLRASCVPLGGTSCSTSSLSCPLVHGWHIDPVLQFQLKNQNQTVYFTTIGQCIQLANSKCQERLQCWKGNSGDFRSMLKNHKSSGFFCLSGIIWIIWCLRWSSLHSAIWESPPMQDSSTSVHQKAKDGKSILKFSSPWQPKSFKTHLWSRGKTCEAPCHTKSSPFCQKVPRTTLEPGSFPYYFAILCAGALLSKLRKKKKKETSAASTPWLYLRPCIERHRTHSAMEVQLGHCLTVQINIRTRAAHLVESRWSDAYDTVTYCLYVTMLLCCWTLEHLQETSGQAESWTQSEMPPMRLGLKACALGSLSWSVLMNRKSVR